MNRLEAAKVLNHLDVVKAFANGERMFYLMGPPYGSDEYWIEESAKGLIVDAIDRYVPESQLPSALQKYKVSRVNCNCKTDQCIHRGLPMHIVVHVIFKKVRKQRNPRGHSRHSKARR